jgi:hypothetical protein
MAIYARADKFPATLDAAQALLASLENEIRSAAAEYNAQVDRTGRPSAAVVTTLNELQQRRDALARHVGRLSADAVLARDLARNEAGVRERQRKLPELLPLPRKNKALLAAEKAVDLAVQSVDRAHEAIRKFSRTEHADSLKAQKLAIALNASHRLAVQEHVAASLALTRERDTWHAACTEALNAAWTERAPDVHALVDKLEELLFPLRSKTDRAVRALRDLRKALPK